MGQAHFPGLLIIKLCLFFNSFEKFEGSFVSTACS